MGRPSVRPLSKLPFSNDERPDVAQQHADEAEFVRRGALALATHFNAARFDRYAGESAWPSPARTQSSIVPIFASYIMAPCSGSFTTIE